MIPGPRALATPDAHTRRDSGAVDEGRERGHWEELSRLAAYARRHRSLLGLTLLLSLLLAVIDPPREAGSLSSSVGSDGIRAAALRRGEPHRVQASDPGKHHSSGPPRGAAQGCGPRRRGFEPLDSAGAVPQTALICP